MTLGSLFDGIGGWQLAAAHAGVTPIWSSETEKFPCAATKHHFPDTVQLGDITKIDADRLESVDIVCAGSPCQDLSVAGKREGLKGARSGLFMDAIRLVRELRRRTGKPRYFVWENVPGAFSSNKGLDFRAVLEEISQTEIPIPPGGKWAATGVVEWGEGSLAWRVLDAQYWGVPQRRKRIFLVADFGGQSAGEILFEPEGMCRNITESRSEGKDVAEGVGNGTQNTDWDGYQHWQWRKCDKYGPLTTGCGRLRGDTPLVQTKIYDISHRSDVIRPQEDGTIPCMTARYGTGDNNVPIVFEPGAATRTGGHVYQDGKAPTLRAEPGDNTPAVFCLAGNTIDREPQNGGNGTGYQKDISYTLNTMDRHAVADFNSRKVGALMGRDYKGMGNQDIESGWQFVIEECKTVRRLTPLECERLQGLPDNYTLIDDKSCSDSARYKALGNGMAQPCADYVIRRIVEVAYDRD